MGTFDTDPGRTSTAVSRTLIARSGALKSPIPVLEVDEVDATIVRLDSK